LEINKSFYGKYVKPAFPVLSFAVGFIWQSIVLNRIDNMAVNIALLLEIVILGLVIIWNRLCEYDKMENQLIMKYKQSYPFLIQFLLGGLFSSYLIFYFQSASLTKTALFLLLIVLLLIISQFFDEHLMNIYVLGSMFFMSCFFFLTFFLPVVLKEMDQSIFIAGGIISYTTTLLLLLYLGFKRTLSSSYVFLKASGIVAIFMAIGYILYFENISPPVPLSMKTGGVYHKIIKEGDTYQLWTEKDKSVEDWIRTYNIIHFSPGDTVYCFVSVFAPSKLKKTIFQRWEYYDPQKRKWLTKDEIGYNVTGGRGMGYRGYTYKSTLWYGRWRVEVTTMEGQIIGRIPFVLVRRKEPVTYYKVVK